MTDLAAPPATDRPRQIVTAARTLLEQEGPEALTMRRLAARVGITAPSLYKHFPDKSSVVNALVEVMLRETAEALEAAESRAPGSFPALAAAYRTHALAHPHLYRLTTGRRLPRTWRNAPRPRSSAPSRATRTAHVRPGPSPTAWSRWS